MEGLLSRITVDPAICHGQRCVRDLRYPVEMLLDLLGSGMTFEAILADYEDLERDDLLAVLAFASNEPITPLTDAQLGELERRLVDSLANSVTVTPWETVKARVLARIKT